MPENDAPQGDTGNDYWPPNNDTSEEWKNPFYPNAVFTTKTTSPEAWAARNSQIPYRGAEQHGVPFKADPKLFFPTPGTDSATVDLVQSYGEAEVPPVNVRVVDTSAPIEERRKVSLSTVPLFPGQTLRIVGERSNRTSLQVWSVAVAGQTVADRIWVSEQDNPQSGYVGVPLDGMAASNPWKTNTTTDLWAVLDSAGTKGAIVCVAEEYTLHIVGTNVKQQPAKHQPLG